MESWIEMAKARTVRSARQKFSHTSYRQPFKGKVKVKLSDLISPALGQALQALGHKEVDMKCAWAITKIMEERQAHLKTLEETRKVLLDKYCEKDETGAYKTNEAKTQYAISDEKAYNDEYAQLVDVDVEVTKLEEGMLEKIQSITPAQLLALKPFLV